jgi:hypothetical protein
MALKLSPTEVWLAGLVTVVMMGFPGQLVAPGETFCTTVTPAGQNRVENNKKAPMVRRYNKFMLIIFLITSPV